MGKVISGPLSMFGIGQKDDPTYNPQVNQSQAYNNFANDADAQYKTALNNGISSVQTGGLTSGLYGENGLQSQLATEGQDLATRGYDLQPQDHEAYGQAAGNIARQFGQQDQDISKSLAKRGLAGGSSGAAGAAFSGAAGNKNEMLAKAQTDIAQKRMADTTQRLQSNRQMQGQLGLQGQQLANSMANDRFNAKSNALGKAAGVESGVNDQGRQANEDMLGHKSKNIGDAWAEGKYSGTKSGESDATASWMKMGSAPSGGGGGGGSGGGGGGGGMMSMFSDENTKTNIHDGSKDIRGFLDSVKPHSYEYKDGLKASGLGGEGEYTSPMAQELEHTDLGSQMVQDTPDGKVVDYGKGFGTLLAAQSDLNSRVKRLEGGLK